MATVTVQTHYNVVFYVHCLSRWYTLGLKMNASDMKFKDGLHIQGVCMYVSL